MSFYRAIAVYYDRIFPFSAAKLDFLRAVTGGGGKRLLDIGCATGELVFAAEGLGLLEPAGIDNDQDLLDIALRKKEEKGSGAEFRNADMLGLPAMDFNGRFDHITCMGNTLVHIADPAAITAFFRSVRPLLMPGGTFTGQIINYDRYTASGRVEFNDIETGDFTFIRECLIRADGSAADFYGELHVKKDDQRYRNRITLYPAGHTFIREGLAAAGFGRVRFYGGFDRSPYGPESGAMIFTAEI